MREAPNQPPADRLTEYLRDRRAAPGPRQLRAGAAGRGARRGSAARPAPGSAPWSRAGRRCTSTASSEYAVPPLGLPDRGSRSGPGGAGPVRVGRALRRARGRGQSGLPADCRQRRPRWPRSALCSTVCRSRSSWPRRESGSCRPRRSWPRFGQRLDTLSPVHATCPTRQQTLRGAIAWSYDLLDERPGGSSPASPSSSAGPIWTRPESRLRRGRTRRPRRTGGPGRSEPDPAGRDRGRAALLDAARHPRVRPRAARGTARSRTQWPSATPPSTAIWPRPRLRA